MSTQTVVVNPDRFIADRTRGPKCVPEHREVSPHHHRLKLKEAGMDTSLARAQKPAFPTVKIDWQAWEAEDRLREQKNWTRILIKLVSR